MRIAPLDGIDIAYRDSGGDGPAILFIHGGLIGDTFERLIAEPALAAYRRIRYQRRDLGESGRSTSPTTSVADHAGDAARLLEHLDVAATHVVGHSFGGAVALRMALDAPERVLTLTLLEGVPHVDVESSPTLATAIFPVVEAITAGDNRRAVEVFLTAVGGTNAVQTMVEGAGYGALAQGVADAPVLIERELRAIAEHHFGPLDAARVTQPALLVLGGESDNAVRATLGEDFFTANHTHLLRMLPAAREAHVPGLAHLLHIERPQPIAIAQFIGAFVPSRGGF